MVASASSRPSRSQRRAWRLASSSRAVTSVGWAWTKPASESIPAAACAPSVCARLSRKARLMASAGWSGNRAVAEFSRWTGSRRLIPAAAVLRVGCVRAQRQGHGKIVEVSYFVSRVERVDDLVDRRVEVGDLLRVHDDRVELEQCSSKPIGGSSAGVLTERIDRGVVHGTHAGHIVLPKLLVESRGAAAGTTSESRQSLQDGHVGVISWDGSGRRYRRGRGRRGRGQEIDRRPGSHGKGAGRQQDTSNEEHHGGPKSATGQRRWSPEGAWFRATSPPLRLGPARARE